MIYEPQLEVSLAEERDDADDESIEHAFHRHRLDEALDKEHSMLDVWPALKPNEKGLTFR